MVHARVHQSIALSARSVPQCCFRLSGKRHSFGGGDIWLRQIVMKLSSVLTLLHPAKIRSANRSFLRTIAYLVVGIVTVDYIRKTMCVICEIIVCKRQKICKLTLRWWGLGLLLYGLLRKTNCVCGFLWDLGNHINASRWASYCSCSVRSPSRM